MLDLPFPKETFDVTIAYGAYCCADAAEMLLDPDTFRLEIEDTNEHGAVMHFLREDAVARMFARFSQLSFELTETTFAARTRRNSDWIVQVTR